MGYVIVYGCTIKMIAIAYLINAISTYITGAFRYIYIFLQKGNNLTCGLCCQKVIPSSSWPNHFITQIRTAMDGICSNLF